MVVRVTQDPPLVLRWMRVDVARAPLEKVILMLVPDTVETMFVGFAGALLVLPDAAETLIVPLKLVEVHPEVPGMEPVSLAARLLLPVPENVKVTVAIVPAEEAFTDPDTLLEVLPTVTVPLNVPHVAPVRGEYFTETVTIVFPPECFADQDREGLWPGFEPPEEPAVPPIDPDIAMATSPS